MRSRFSRNNTPRRFSGGGFRIIAASLTLATAFLARADAHDMWLEPGPGLDEGAMQTRFLVGHAGDRGDYKFRPDRITKFLALDRAGRSDLTETMRAAPAADLAPAVDLDAGASMIAFATTAVPISLETEKFLSYAEEEGLTNAIRFAEENDQDAYSERYSRRAKLFVARGENARTPESALSPVGLTLEITPLEDPFARWADAPTPFRVTYKGEPLSGASVSLESLQTPGGKQRKISDEDGVVGFRFPKAGAWKINVVWTEPSGAVEEDFETIFSSLTIFY